MRSFPTFIFAPLICLLFAGCFSRAPVELPSGEVLRRAIFATQTLDGVDFESTVSLTASGQMPVQATLVLTGTLAPLRRAWTFNLGGDIERTADQLLSIKARVASSSPGNIFVWLDELRESNADNLSGKEILLRQWIQIGSGSSVRASPQAPDPRMSEALVSSLAVKSGGLQQAADGSYVYRYTLDISPGLIASTGDTAITGDVTIDAHSFHVLRAIWTLSKIPLSIGQADAHIDVHFHDHNRTRARIPALTGSAVKTDAIFDMIYGD